MGGNVPQMGGRNMNGNKWAAGKRTNRNTAQLKYIGGVYPRSFIHIAVAAIGQK
jgi:hypothetical protein